MRTTLLFTIFLLLPACSQSPDSPADLGDASASSDASPISHVDLATYPPGAGPPFPLVLVHGMGGFRNIGPVDYFYRVPAALEKDGHKVFISRHDPINDSDTRGAQVEAYVQMVLAMSGKAKVNLIGHSQGGFDARYVASRMGDRVGAVVTVGSPMGGDPIADIAVSAGPQANDAINVLLDLYGAANGFDSNAKGSIGALTTDGANAFFARHPDDARVTYFSLTGRSAGSTGGPDCQVPDAPDFVRRWNGENDPVTPLLAIPSGMLDRLDPKPVHDGLVTVPSARHGRFLGCVPADHMDEVNQLLGDSPGIGNSFDAIRFYRDLAAWLAAQGF